MVKTWTLGSLAAALLCAGCGADSKDTNLPAQGGTQSGQGGTQAGGSGAGGGSSGGSGGTRPGTGGTVNTGGGSGGGAITPSPCFPVPSGEPFAQVLATTVPGSFVSLSSTLAKMDGTGRTVTAGVWSYSPARLFVGRLLPDGSPDPNFGDGGEVEIPFEDPPDKYLHVLEIDPDGRIWVGGLAEENLSAPSSAFVARVLDSGELDTTFNPAGPTPGLLLFRPRVDGPETADVGAVVRSIAFSSAGTFVNGDPSLGFLERLLDDGSFDPAFNISSRFNGDLKVFGQTLYMLNAYLGPDLSAWTLDGEPRTDFGTEGSAALRAAFDPTDMLQAANGDLIVSNYRATLGRVDAGGALVATFGTDGYTPSSTPCTVTHMALLCDGRIVGVGHVISPPLYCAVAYTADGQLMEGTPAEGAYTWEPPELFGSSSVWLFMDPTGHIVAFTERNNVVHFERYVPPWATP